MDERRSRLIVHLSGHRTETLCCQTGKDHILVYAVLGDPLHIEQNGYLFVLLSEDLDTTHLAYLTQSVSRHLGVFLQLTRGSLGTLYRQEKTTRIAEIIDHRDRQQTRRHLHLFEQTDAASYLRPCFVTVHHFGRKGGEDIAHSVLAQTVCLAFVDLLEGKEILLYRFGYLLLHFLRRSTREDSYHKSLTDRHLRELVFLHLSEGKDTKQYQHRHHRIDDAVVTHCAFYMVSCAHINRSLLLRCTSSGIPWR